MNSIPALSSVAPEELYRRLELEVAGRVHSVVGMLVEGTCPGVAVGDLVEINRGTGVQPLVAETVGLRDGRVLMVPLGDLRGVTAGARVARLGVAASIPCTDGLLGRVVDSRGRPLDHERGPLVGPFAHRRLYADPPPALERALVNRALHVGVRAIDGMLTLGEGQRVGIMAGAGVGKSTLLGTLARSADADVNVIALIGERGREVGEFLSHVLTPESRERTVVVVATSDQSPLERMRGAFVAATIADHFSHGGKRVLLLMDSLTRFAMAQRELGLSAGEPPATRGYTPSVFALLPRLLERSGNFADRGPITGLYTVLVEGDDMNDPIGDSARAILDGHFVMSRRLASIGHHPAIDVGHSVSRVMDKVMPPSHIEVASRVRTLLADLAEAEELLAMGAYVPGASAPLDRALQRKDAVRAFLRQLGSERTPYPQTLRAMVQLAEGVQ